MFIEVINHSSGQVDMQGSEGPAIPEPDRDQLEVVCTDMYARMGNLDIFGPTPNQFNQAVAFGSGSCWRVHLYLWFLCNFQTSSGSPHGVVHGLPLISTRQGGDKASAGDEGLGLARVTGNVAWVV